MKERFSRVQDDNLTQMNRMNRSISHGSTYWYVNPEETRPTERTFRDSASGYVAGLIKTSPSRTNRPQRLHLRAPNCYINDVVVDPRLQRSINTETNHRLGSMLLHAALKFGDFKPQAKLALDGYVGNYAANAWFERLRPASRSDGRSGRLGGQRQNYPRTGSLCQPSGEVDSTPRPGPRTIHALVGPGQPGR